MPKQSYMKASASAYLLAKHFEWQKVIVLNLCDETLKK